MGNEQFPDTDPIIAHRTDKQTGEKWIATAQKGWIRVPTMQHERTTIAPNMLERVGKGVDDITSGVKQGLLYMTDKDKYDQYTAEKDAENAYYDKALNESNFEGMDLARLSGGAGILAPLGLAGQGEKALTQLISGGTQGAIAGGSMYTPADQSKLMQVAGGTIGGGLGNVVASKVASGAADLFTGAVNTFNKLRSKISPETNIKVMIQKAGIDLDNLPEQIRGDVVADARKQLELTGSLDAKALQRKMDAESLGFKGEYGMTAGQATRDPTLWSREQNLAKTEDGLPILGRLKNQNQRFTEQLRDELPKSTIFGDDVGESIFDSVTNKWRGMQDEVGKVYSKIDQEMDGFTINGMPDFEDSLKVMGDDATITKLTSSVLARGKRIGLFGDEARPVTVKNVEQFRKFINGLADGNDPTLMMRKREIIDLLDDNVVGATQNDAYKVARAKASERFKEFETALVNKIVKGKLSPDKLFETTLKAPRKELEALKYSLNKSHVEGQPAAGAETWQSIQSETLDHLWRKATAGMGADAKFSGTMFKKEMDKIGKKKLAIIFEPEDLAQLYKIRDTSINMTREPIYSSVNYSNTTPAAYNLLSRIPSIGNAFKEAGQQANVDLTLNRAMSSAPAVKLTPDEVMENMKGLLGVSPVLRGFMGGGNSLLQATRPQIIGSGLLGAQLPGQLLE